MVTTLLTQHRAGTRSLASLTSPATEVSTAYAAPLGDATTIDATPVVNPWLGGGMCGGDVNGVDAGHPFRFATKRIQPGRLEGMT